MSIVVDKRNVRGGLQNILLSMHAKVSTCCWYTNGGTVLFSSDATSLLVMKRFCCDVRAEHDTTRLLSLVLKLKPNYQTSILQTEQIKKMETTVQFGKYKGRSFEEVLTNDPNYARWALNTLTNDTRKNQASFVAYLKEHQHMIDSPADYSQDPLLKDAWYLDPRAQLLVQHDLNPKLPIQCCPVTSAVTYCSAETISIEEYRSMLDQDLLRQHDARVHDEFDFERDFTVTLTTGEYFLKPEIVNAAMALYDKYMKNMAADEPYILTPSKVISTYWLTGRRMHGKAAAPTGKWTLFFDKMKENADGLTELDICYRLLQENFASITNKYSFKVSTRRPNPNAANSRTGVVVVYCSEEDRVEIFLQLARLLSLKRGKYYWKHHKSTYAKDGVKASDFCYTLDADSDS